MKKKQRLCTSKKVLFSVLVFGGLFLLVILIGWLFFDRTDAAGFAGVVCGPIAVSLGFYSWKAKHENMKKLGYTYKQAEEELNNE